MKFEEMTVGAFIDELASDSPAPGGGSVAALCGSLAAGLTAMVGTSRSARKNTKTTGKRWTRCAPRAKRSAPNS